MKKLALLSLVIFAALPVSAREMSFNKKLELCSLFAQANAMGVSGKEIMRQSLVEQGQPGYLAKVIYGEIKSVCPRVY